MRSFVTKVVANHKPMENRNKPKYVNKEQGPFTYVYISITAVPGVKIPSNSDDIIIYRSYSEISAEAFLTNNWDKYCVHYDRGVAIGTLLLTAFRGTKRFGKYSVYWHRLLKSIFGIEWVFRRNLEIESNIVCQERHKASSNSGCYLIYRAEGKLFEPPNIKSARQIGTVGFGFDVIDSDAYKKQQRKAIHTTATALSLVLSDTTGSPDTQFIGDVIYLKGKDDFTLYCKTIKMGNVNLSTTSTLTNGSIKLLDEYIAGLLSDNKIESATSLFVQSQLKSNDNLRAFIAAWSALELLINRLEKMNREKWISFLKNDNTITPPWDKDLIDIDPKKYRLRDKFFAISCILDLDSARTDSDIFVNINNKRSGFYHRMEIKDEDLPTNSAQLLFRKYLKIHLSNKKFNND